MGALPGVPGRNLPNIKSIPWGGCAVTPESPMGNNPASLERPGSPSFTDSFLTHEQLPCNSPRHWHRPALIPRSVARAAYGALSKRLHYYWESPWLALPLPRKRH